MASVLCRALGHCALTTGNYCYRNALGKHTLATPRAAMSAGEWPVTETENRTMSSAIQGKGLGFPFQWAEE
jgi:hypothetical protein